MGVVCDVYGVYVVCGCCMRVICTCVVHLHVRAGVACVCDIYVVCYVYCVCRLLSRRCVM